MTAIGEYADDDTGSTLKAVDYKEPKDLVVPQAFNLMPESKQGKWLTASETDTSMSLPTTYPADRGVRVVEATQPAVLMTMREGAPGGGKGPLLSSEESLATGNGQTLFQPEPWGFSAGNSQQARSMGEEEGVSPPIRAAASGTNQAPTVGPVAFDEMNFTTSDQHHVLRAGTKQSTGVVEPFCVQGSVEGRSDNSGPGGSGWKQGESFTLNTADRHSIASQTYGVRRLTPVECERLQAFPDGWTEPAGSDSARYKALGNAVTVNTVGWILRRMKALM